MSHGSLTAARAAHLVASFNLINGLIFCPGGASSVLGVCLSMSLYLLCCTCVWKGQGQGHIPSFVLCSYEMMCSFPARSRGKNHWQPKIA
jgi:hypothetical protein